MAIASPQETLRRAIGSTSANPPSARISQPIDVAWYGAVGDGVTDDTAAISAAITAAGANGVVLFRAGKTYIMSTFVSVPANGVTLIGYGATIKASTQALFVFFLFYNRTGGRVEGLTFDGSWTNAASVNSAMVDIGDSTNITIRNCFFKDVSSQCIRMFGACLRVQVTGCRFTNFFNGIFSDDNGSTMPIESIIEGNHFYSANTSAGLSAGIKIAGIGNINSRARHVISNNVMNAPGEMGIEIQTGVNDCTISGNTIYGAIFGISISGCWRAALTGNVLRANTYIGIEIADGSAGITVNGGSVDGLDTAGVAQTFEGIGVGAGCSNVTIGGVTVGNCLTRAFYILAPHVLVSGCTAVVSQANSLGLHVKNCTDVTFIGNYLRCTSASATDMVTIDSTDAVVRRVTVADNTFVGTIGRFGVFVWCNNFDMSDIEITGNKTQGFVATTAMYNETIGAGVLTKVWVKDNRGAGLQDPTNSLNLPVLATTSSLLLTPIHDTILVDATGGVKTETLPTSVGMAGKEYEVQKRDASGNAVTIAATGGQTFNGAATISLAAQFDRARVKSDGANWVIIQSN